MGVVSFINSVKAFNAHPTFGNGLALLADSLALAAPGVPGGAGTVLKGSDEIIDGAKSGNKSFRRLKNEDGFARIGSGPSANQLNRAIQAGKAPKTILRVDGGSKELIHVHFSDRTAIYANGTYKHGGNHKFTNKEVEFLRQNDFKIPTN